MRVLLAMTLGIVTVVAHARDPDPIPQHPKPAVFADLSLDDAVARSAAGKLAVVNVTAAWCGPCKAMDRTTWNDQAVVAWISANAVAISLDADARRADSERLRVAALPTVVVFRGGIEFERRTGYVDGPGMAAWLSGLAEGRRLGDDARQRLADAEASPRTISPAQAHALAAELQSFGDLDSAAAACVLGWTRAEGSHRDDTLAPIMSRLARDHAPARARFETLRDRAEAQAPRAASERGAWITLCSLLGDDDRVLAWVDDELNRAPAGDSLWAFDDRLEPILTRARRWAELGRVIADPPARVEAIAQGLRDRLSVQAPLGSPDAEADNRANRGVALAWSRDRAATLIGTLFAGDRADEARAACRTLVSLDDTPEFRLAVVERAIEMRAVTADHVSWLDQAARAGADVTALRTRLDALAQHEPGAPRR